MGVLHIPAHYGDDTVSACVVAGDYAFLAHHAGGLDRPEDIEYQMRAAFRAMAATLAKVNGSLEDLVQVNLYLKDITQLRKAADVFREFIKGGAPARMTSTTAFFEPACLCMMDGIAYLP